MTFSDQKTIQGQETHFKTPAKDRGVRKPTRPKYGNLTIDEALKEADRIREDVSAMSPEQRENLTRRARSLKQR